MWEKKLYFFRMQRASKNTKLMFSFL